MAFVNFGSSSRNQDANSHTKKKSRTKKSGLSPLENEGT